MPDLTDEYAQNHPYRALGRRFWVLWSLAVLALVVAYGTMAFFVHDMLLPRRVIIVGSGSVLFFLAWCGLFLLPRRMLVQRGLAEPMRPAIRRYVSGVFAPMLIFVVVLIAATYYAKATHPTGFAALLAGLAPAVPILFALHAMYRLGREETDEYLRDRIQKISGLAALLAIAASAVLGFLDQFQLIPHIPLWWVFPLWSIGMVPAQYLLKRHNA